MKIAEYTYPDLRNLDILVTTDQKTSLSSSSKKRPYLRSDWLLKGARDCERGRLCSRGLCDKMTPELGLYNTYYTTYIDRGGVYILKYRYIKYIKRFI